MRDYFGNLVYGHQIVIRRPAGNGAVQNIMGQIDGLSQLFGYYPALDCGGFLGHNYEHSGNREDIYQFLKNYFSGRYSKKVHGDLYISWTMGCLQEDFLQFLDKLRLQLS